MNGSIARRYARALIQLAQETSQIESFGKILEDLVALLHGSPQILNALANDLFDVHQRLAAVGEMADVLHTPQLFKNFLSLLVKKERFDYLPAIAREYQRFQDEILGVVRVSVVTPKAPDASLLQRVETILGLRLQKKVISHGESKPEILGGMILKVNNTIYDSSVRRELQRIKETMLKG